MLMVCGGYGVFALLKMWCIILSHFHGNLYCFHGNMTILFPANTAFLRVWWTWGSVVVCDGVVVCGGQLIGAVWWCVVVCGGVW